MPVKIRPYSDGNYRHSYSDGNYRPPYSRPADLLVPGRASDYILPFHVTFGRFFVLLCRVSSHEQGDNDNLWTQRTTLRQAVEALYGIVMKVLEYEWSGYGPGWEDKLTEAANVARKYGATLLAFSTDRFIRSPMYWSTSPMWSRVQAQERDLKDLKEATAGVRLMTYLHPDASPEECRSWRIRSGQEVKGNKGGRPKKPQPFPWHQKAWREKWQPYAFALQGDGRSAHHIAKEISLMSGKRITRATILNWLKKTRETTTPST